MTRAADLLYRRFIAPAERFGKHAPERVGAELEYPVVGARGEDARPEVMRRMLHDLTRRGFKPRRDADTGRIVGAQKDAVGAISFDTSYHNLEFSLAPKADIAALERAFISLRAEVEALLSPSGCVIAASGIHPRFGFAAANFVPDAEAEAERAAIRAYAKKGRRVRCDFFAFISSAQTHIEIAPADLPAAIHLFSALDFAEYYLFANSPLTVNDVFYACGRDYFYCDTMLRGAGLAGTLDRPFRSIDDLLDDYANRAIFLRKRKTWEIFAPTPLKEYFSGRAHQALEEDLSHFYSYRTVELKKQGTLERRTACTQASARTFAPAAFHLGVANNRDAAAEAVERFRRDQRVNVPNSALSAMAAKGVRAWANPNRLDAFLREIVGVARAGLKRRGRGEERYLTGICDMRGKPDEEK